MLLDVANDHEFQAFLDKAEQQLHVRIFPIIVAGIRLRMVDLSKNDKYARSYMIKRGRPVLELHYKNLYRQVFNSVVQAQQKATRTGLTAFMDAQLEWLRDHAAQMIKYISDSLMDDIAEMITDGVELGWSNNKIKREILQRTLEDDDGTWSQARAATVARTETHNAATYAMDETIKFNDIKVKTKQWLSAGDNRVRPEHALLDGKTVDYDEPFVSKDGKMMFPGDQSLDADPSGFINCRCTCLYLTTEAEATHEIS